MLDSVWFIFFVAAFAGLLVTSIALFLTLRRAPEGGREFQSRYAVPDYDAEAGFSVYQHPDSDILIPLRFWLVNDRTAEIEYNIVPNNFAQLRVALEGQLTLPEEYTETSYESETEYQVAGITISQKLNPGRRCMLRWAHDGFEYALLAPRPEMNIIGGVAPQFVARTTGHKETG